MNDESRFNSPLEKRLENWKVSAPVDPQMKQHVLRRIAVGAAEKNHRNLEGGVWGWVLGNRMAVTSFACAAVLLACTVVLYTRQSRLNHELASSSQSYFLMINPVAHANAAGDAKAASKEPSTIEMLAWMRDRFHLSREQFRQLVALHEDYNDRLVTLYKELAAIQTEYNGYETRRVKNEEIDFMALYDLLQKRDAVRKDSTETSAQLVELVLRVLTPEQKRAYLALMNRFTPLSDRTPETTPSHAGA